MPGTGSFKRRQSVNFKIGITVQLTSEDINY
jgi:hypothetical protein